MKMIARILIPTFSVLVYSASAYSALQMDVSANDTLKNVPAMVDFFERGSSVYCQEKFGNKIEQVIITQGGINHTSLIEDNTVFCVLVQNDQNRKNLYYGPYRANKDCKFKVGELKVGKVENRHILIPASACLPSKALDDSLSTYLSVKVHKSLGELGSPEIILREKVSGKDCSQEAGVIIAKTYLEGTGLKPSPLNPMNSSISLIEKEQTPNSMYAEFCITYIEPGKDPEHVGPFSARTEPDNECEVVFDGEGKASTLSNFSFSEVCKEALAQTVLMGFKNADSNDFFIEYYDATGGTCLQEPPQDKTELGLVNSGILKESNVPNNDKGLCIYLLKNNTIHEKGVFGPFKRINNGTITIKKMSEGIVEGPLLDGNVYMNLYNADPAWDFWVDIYNTVTKDNKEICDWESPYAPILKRLSPHGSSERVNLGAVDATTNAPGICVYIIKHNGTRNHKAGPFKKATGDTITIKNADSIIGPSMP